MKCDGVDAFNKVHFLASILLVRTKWITHSTEISKEATLYLMTFITQMNVQLCNFCWETESISTVCNL